MFQPVYVYFIDRQPRSSLLGELVLYNLVLLLEKLAIDLSD